MERYNGSWYPGIEGIKSLLRKRFQLVPTSVYAAQRSVFPRLEIWEQKEIHLTSICMPRASLHPCPLLVSSHMSLDLAM